MEPLPKSPAWRISPAKNFPAFLRALALLVPETAILYVEGGKPPKAVERFLETNRVDDTTKIPSGTLFPRPSIYRIRSTRGNLESLATIGDQFPTPVGSIHLHVFQGSEILVASFDAFMDPFWISRSIPEDKVHDFCAGLGLSYEKAETK